MIEKQNKKQGNLNLFIILGVSLLLILSLVSAGLITNNGILTSELGDEEQTTPTLDNNRINDIYRNNITDDFKQLLGFKLGKISELYSDIEQGEINLDGLVFLDEKGREIEVEEIVKRDYDDKIYDVDVENDIVLVMRNDGRAVWSGNSNNGTAVDGAHQVDAGYLGKGFEFDGDDDYIDCGNRPDFNFTNHNFSISGWFNSKSFAIDSFVISKGSAAAHSPYVFWLATDKIRILISNSTCSGFLILNELVSPTLSTNTWYNFVFTKEENRTYLYVDGDLVDSFNMSSDTICTTTDSLSIGTDLISGSPTNEFNGSIDDVLIFNRSLSADEIKGLYANSSSKYVSNNFTGLTEGTQTFTSYVQDEGGNVNSSTLSFDVDLTYPDITYDSTTDADSSSVSRTNIFVNVSANDTASGNISTFIDFDNSLVGWWRMDDVNSTGDPWDRSPYCYDNETKIMTDSGLKYFWELTGDEMVMTLNAETGEKEWQKPMERQEFDYEGEMYEIKTKKGSLTVSPEHIIWGEIESEKQISITDKIKHLKEEVIKLFIVGLNYLLDWR